MGPDLDPREWPTPRVVVDRARLAANIRRTQDIAERWGVRLRPHAKTHKSVAVARMQVAAGAVGVTAAKPAEAQVFVEGGIPSVLLAFPVIEAFRIDDLLDAARSSGAEVRLIAERREGVLALSEAARRHGLELPVLLKVDVGLHRVGVPADGPDAPAVARAVAAAPGLRLSGIVSHAGHAYAAAGPDAIADVAEAERRAMLRVQARLRAEGLAVEEVSVGSTPTVLAQRDFSGITEIRPGNAVFLDGTAVRLGIATEEDVALWVHATVVGVTDRHAIVDAGSKVLSSDLGPHGTGGAGYGLARPFAGGAPMVVERLSEEHGWLRLDGQAPALGSRVAILPNHACPVANLALGLVLAGGERAPERLPVDARGLVH
jgi:D-serine deaminase-like pyridoxal phosphate-dependent protein